MLVHEVSPPRRRWWPVAAALALAGVISAAILLDQKPRGASPAPAPVVADPAPAPATPPPAAPPSPSPPAVCDPQHPPAGAIDEPIEYVAAASDAPVIAVASLHHVWISRDDGKTFTRALESGGGIRSLFAEPDGRVYAVRGDWVNHPAEELGIAEPDGRERWREPPGDALPVDARGGWIVGMASPDGMLVGWDAGNKWERIPATHGWNPWRLAMGTGRVSYYLAKRIDAVDHSMHLLAASEAGRARSLWSMPLAEEAGVGTPDGIIPCAALAGDTLYIVVRGTRPGSSRLLAIGPDGHPHERLGQLFDDPKLTCDIAGNERATYMTLHTSVTMYRVIRIDTDEPRDVAEYTTGFKRIVVDAHGNLVFLENGCLQRVSQAGRQTQLVCGPDHR